MESDIQFWGFVVMGFLQAYVALSVRRILTLRSACNVAYAWSEETTAPDDSTEFVARVQETYNNTTKISVDIGIAFILNCMMIYFIDAGEVPVLLQIGAALMNATVIVSFLTAGKVMGSIVEYMTLVELSNMKIDPVISDKIKEFEEKLKEEDKTDEK